MARFFRRFNNTVVNKIGTVVGKLLGSFLGFDKGVFVLNHGTHEITVPLNICTNKIWVSVDQDRIGGCGQNPVDYVGYRLLANKVTFFVQVNTEQCRVSWFANESKGDREYWRRWEKESHKFDKKPTPAPAPDKKKGH